VYMRASERASSQPTLVKSDATRSHRIKRRRKKQTTLALQMICKFLEMLI
jgi:hypothetical protein